MNQISPQPSPYENLDPQQQEDYKKAITLAHAADAAFDSRKDQADLLAGVVATEDDDEFSSRIDGAQKSFEEEDKNFHTLKQAAEVLMPPYTAFETQNSKDKSADSTDEDTQRDSN